MAKKEEPILTMSRLKRNPSYLEVKKGYVPGVKYIHQVLPAGSWSGRRCFIVGGGDSLRGFDFSRLDGELVIGVNRAYERCNPQVILWSDSRVWGWAEKGVFGRESQRKFRESRAFKTAIDIDAIPFPYPEDVIRVKEFRSGLLSDDLESGIVLGGNTGFAALNLAICLGASEIYLLGFDMHGKDGQQTWWHDGYPEKQADSVYESYINQFNQAAEEIKKRARVVNCNRDSSLRCFEFGEAEQESVYIEGYAGIGDNFWQRPFIKELSKRKTVYLMTFTPQVYWDLQNVKFVRTPYPEFVSHNKIADSFSEWVEKPIAAKEIKKPQYWFGFHAGLTISEQFEEIISVEKYDFSFPLRPEWTEEAKRVISSLDTKGKKICLVRFPVQRKEWNNVSREPKPEYLQLLIDRYKDEYYFISIADFNDGNEKFYQEPKNIDKEFHNGELSFGAMCGMIKLSDMIISSHCFLFPMAIAIGAKIFCIFGGCQKPELFLDSRMNLNNVSYVAPDPFCNCLKSGHDCNKDIPEEKIVSEFEKLKARKNNLLIHKVGPVYHESYKSNKDLTDKYNLLFAFEADEKYLVDNKIDAVISTEYPLDRMKSICASRGINYLFCEAFLGKKNVLDRVGAHFTPENEMRFVSGAKKISGAELPNWTKMEQPKEITEEELFAKYNLSRGDRHIVIMGQEIDDKSLIYSRNSKVRTYEEYVYQLVMNNRDIKFLFKPHPAYKTFKDDKTEFIGNYRNVIMVYENIHSLFKIFDKFTAWSSTTIMEGLFSRRKFATIGYHFCDSESLVLRIKDFHGIYNQLERFTIDEEERQRTIDFLCNTYAVDLSGRQLLDRLEMSSEEYFLTREGKCS